MPSKLNYFVYKEQSTISPNHFNRYLRVVKEGCDVSKTDRVNGFCTRSFQTHVITERLN